MKILKKVLAVLGVACMLFAVAIPCFAWEWNATTPGYMTSPILPIRSSYLANVPLFGLNDPDTYYEANSFTTNAYMLTLNLPSDFDIFPDSDPTEGNLTQGDGSTYLDVRAGKQMIFTDPTEVIARVQAIWDTEFDSGTPAFPLRQFYGCDSVAQVSFTYDRISSPSTNRHFLETYAVGATHISLLDTICGYKTYSYVVDGGTHGVTATAYYQYRNTENGWSSGIFKYEGYDWKYYVENDNRDYYEYTAEIGLALANEIRAKDDFDAQQPFVIIDELSVGTTEANGPVRAYRNYNLVGIHQSYSTMDNNYDNIFEPTYFNLQGFGGNMISNMLWSGYVSNVEIPPNAIPPEMSNATGFLSTALGGFLDFSIVPGITLGGILATVLCIALFITFLKIFAGG